MQHCFEVRRVQCFFRGQVVFDRETDERVSDIVEYVADCVCHGMVEQIHVIQGACSAARFAATN